MSEQFYERFLSLFFGFVVLLTLIVVTIELFFFYFSTQNLVFYYAYLMTLVFCLVYFARYFLQFRDFQNRLGLLIPANERSPSDLEPLKVNELEDVSLRACLCYRNGASFSDIERDFALGHPTQAKRELIKGLGFLLRFYEEHKEVSR